MTVSMMQTGTILETEADVGSSLLGVKFYVYVNETIQVFFFFCPFVLFVFFSLFLFFSFCLFLFFSVFSSSITHFKKQKKWTNHRLFVWDTSEDQQKG